MSKQHETAAHYQPVQSGQGLFNVLLRGFISNQVDLRMINIATLFSTVLLHDAHGIMFIFYLLLLLAYPKFST